MECPHCRIEIHEGWAHSQLNDGNAIGSVPNPKPEPSQPETTKVTASGMSLGRPQLMGAPVERFSTVFFAGHMSCPACQRAIIRLNLTHPGALQMGAQSWIVYPRNAAARRAASEVPTNLAEDFNEASLVLDLSPKSSAALSRRCLQSMLRDRGYIQHDLAKQIDALLDAKILPSALAENVDAIRNTGNFAAHPMKDTNSGAIMPVEPHEAEWNLDVLEGLFDYFYVAPARDAARKAAFNAKLAAAGKPPMK